MKIIIGGGGTAGHLVPGIALYQELKKNKNNQLLYVSSNRDNAYDISRLLDPEERITVSLISISRKLSFSTGKQLFSIFKAWLKSYQTIKKFNPDIMVITGGYLSNIVALSAFLMKKPLYILEQNSVAGITNRVWAKVAKKVFTTFPNPKFIPSKKIIHTGNPLLYTEQLSKEKAKKIFDLSGQDKKIIGISGGSQGAKAINDLVFEMIPSLVKNGYQIIWSLGTREYERLNNQLSYLDEYKQDVKVYRFIERMNAFWSASDIVLARAGAGTVSEALLFKTPTLFIPIYQSPDNHQYLNAKFLVDYQVAKIIEEPNLNTELLWDTLTEMLSNNQTYRLNFPSQENNPATIIIKYLSN